MSPLPVERLSDVSDGYVLGAAKGASCSNELCPAPCVRSHRVLNASVFQNFLDAAPPPFPPVSLLFPFPSLIVSSLEICLNKASKTREPPISLAHCTSVRIDCWSLASWTTVHSLALIRRLYSHFYSHSAALDDVLDPHAASLQ